MHPGTLAWAAADGYCARYCVGETPKTRRKLVVNDPTLWSPTEKQIRATDQSVVRRRVAARSRRRVRRYWCGDSPKVWRNSRLKCAGESRADRARSATVRGSK